MKRRKPLISDPYLSIDAGPPCGHPVLTNTGKLLGFCEKPRGHIITPHTYLVSSYAILRGMKHPRGRKMP